MRQFLIALSGIILVAIAVLVANYTIESKKPFRTKAKQVTSTAFVSTVQNSDVPVLITESGRLVAKNKMDLFSEVQGVMEATAREFKPGSRFKKGEILLRIRNNDYYANLQAQKSVLQNLITSILPDLRLDYPEAYQKWDLYLKQFDMDKPISELPVPSSEKEKFFITGKNIYTTYYNTKNLELVYAKYNIQAPFSGVLTETTVNPGTVIRPGQRLGEFIDPSVYEMQVAVSQSMITSLSVGISVEVVQPENPSESWTGRITRINGKVDPTTQTVQVFIELSGEGLKDGMFLEARMPGKAKNNAYEVNRRLLVDEEGLFLVKDSSLVLQPVSILHKGEKTAIVRGLPDGAQLVSKAIPGAYHGMPVSVYTEKN